MRYQNWDVLLFPGASRVPIQEFETKFHVLSASQRASAPSTAIDDPFTDFESMTKLPLLTCFIASLPADAPFRVSIHSWSRPTGSYILETCWAKDESVAFQARVYIDGVHQWYVFPDISGL
jgi:hypothetical protein